MARRNDHANHGVDHRGLADLVCEDGREKGLVGLRNSENLKAQFSHVKRNIYKSGLSFANARPWI